MSEHEASTYSTRLLRSRPHQSICRIIRDEDFEDFTGFNETTVKRARVALKEQLNEYKPEKAKKVKHTIGFDPIDRRDPVRLLENFGKAEDFKMQIVVHKPDHYVFGGKKFIDDTMHDEALCGVQPGISDLTRQSALNDIFEESSQESLEDNQGSLNIGRGHSSLHNHFEQPSQELLEGSQGSLKTGRDYSSLHDLQTAKNLTSHDKTDRENSSLHDIFEQSSEKLLEGSQGSLRTGRAYSILSDVQTAKNLTSHERTGRENSTLYDQSLKTGRDHSSLHDIFEQSSEKLLEGSQGSLRTGRDYSIPSDVQTAKSLTLHEKTGRENSILSEVQTAKNLTLFDQSPNIGRENSALNDIFGELSEELLEDNQGSVKTGRDYSSLHDLQTANSLTLHDKTGRENSTLYDQSLKTGRENSSLYDVQTAKNLTLFDQSHQESLKTGRGHSILSDVQTAKSLISHEKTGREHSSLQNHFEQLPEELLENTQGSLKTGRENSTLHDVQTAKSLTLHEKTGRENSILSEVQTAKNSTLFDQSLKTDRDYSSLHDLQTANSLTSHDKTDRDYSSLYDLQTAKSLISHDKTGRDHSRLYDVHSEQPSQELLENSQGSLKTGRDHSTLHDVQTAKNLTSHDKTDRENSILSDVQTAKNLTLHEKTDREYSSLYDVQTAKNLTLFDQSLKTDRENSILSDVQTAKNLTLFDQSLKTGRGHSALNDIFGESSQESLEGSQGSLKTGRDYSSLHDLQTANSLTSHYKKLLQTCKQSEVIPFSDLLTSKKKPIKIGEGSYGEVFATQIDGIEIALKIVPFNNDTEQRVVNGEYMKTTAELLPEAVISQELSLLSESSENNTKGFVQLVKMRVVQGEYPKKLIDAWNTFKKNKPKEAVNKSPKEYASESQLYLAFAFENSGTDLEKFEVNGEGEAISIMFQIITSLRIAEKTMKFEHRDLHIGNVLIERVKPKKRIQYCIDNTEFKLKSNGVVATIIDFTNSRISKDGITLFLDLSIDFELFQGPKSDYQFEIYRLMKKENNNTWHLFTPKTNCLWVHYLSTKLLKAKGIRIRRRKELEQIFDMVLVCDDLDQFMDLYDVNELLQSYEC